MEVSNCEPGEYGGQFIQIFASEPKTFNSLVPSDYNTSIMLGKVFSSLFDYDPIQLKNIPSLATEWEVSEDSKTYTIQLRKGIKWSDGHPFSADDVIFTFDCMLATETDPESGEKRPKYPSRNFVQYTIGGEPMKYRKIDSHTVEFSIKEIYAPFINDISYASIMPKHKLESAFQDGSLLSEWTTKTAIENPSEIVGTGPYRILSYHPGQRLLMEANPYYWKKDKKDQRLPYINHLVYKFVEDSNANTILFATRESDSAGISPEDLSWVRKKEAKNNFKVLDKGPDSGISFIWFNLHPGSNDEGKPYVDPVKFRWFSNKKFRQAILHAYDRQALIDAVYFGKAQLLHSITSPANKKWHNPNTPKYLYDPDKAKELFAEMGFTYNEDGQLLDDQQNLVQFRFLVPSGSSSHEARTTMFKEFMRKVGIDLQVRFLDWSTLVQKIQTTYDYDCATMGFSGGGDPSGGKALWRSDGHLHIWHPKQETPSTEWEAEVDKLWEEQEKELNEEKRIQIFHKIQDIYSDELPLLFLVNPLTYSGIRNEWQNVQLTPEASILWNLDELWYKEGNE
jgi:peptide/nickel transport system substrate-binding protein